MKPFLTPGRTTVIAEIGSCHENDWGKAKRLIDAAAEAGCDVVKAQYCSDPIEMATRRNIKDPTFYVGHIGRHPPIDELCSYAHEKEMLFGCSTYLPKDIWKTAEASDMLKISSFESQDRELLSAHKIAVAAGKPVVISLGFMGGAYTALSMLDSRRSEDDRKNIHFLHCVSAYPATLDLGLIRIRDRMDDARLAGFSDHAPINALMSGAIAVAAGAYIIEKHLRLDDTSTTCPDYPHSLSPKDFAAYVSLIRIAETMIGTASIKDREIPNEGYRVGL